MVTYWTNFAKSGNPNARDMTYWPKFTNKEKDYLEFGSDNSVTSKQMLWQNRMKFWFDLKGQDYMMKETTNVPSFATKP